MMEVLLTQLRDFSCRSPNFDDHREPAGRSVCRVPPRRVECLGEAAEGGRKLDIESALAWLRKELVGFFFRITSLFTIIAYKVKLVRQLTTVTTLKLCLNMHRK